MSSLQDKINNARLQNNQTANDAIEDIDKQTQGLITNFDRLTIDRPSKESRREAALKVLERVKNGEIEKVDEDEIKTTHDEIKDCYVDPVQLNHSSDFYVDTQKNDENESESIKIQDHKNEDQNSNLSQETSNALKRLQAMSELLNDDDINNKIQTDQKSQSIKSSFNNKSEVKDNKLEDQDKKEESLHEVKDDTKTETKHEKQSLFKKMINFFKGE